MNNKPTQESPFFSKETIAATLKKCAGLYFGLSLAGAIVMIIFCATSLYDEAAVLGVAVSIAAGITSYFIGALIFAAGEAIENLQTIAKNANSVNDDNGIPEKNISTLHSSASGITAELPDL